jgi:peptide/nickel transport system permease protein
MRPGVVERTASAQAAPQRLAFLRRLWSRRYLTLKVGVVLFAIIVLATALAPLLTHYDPIATVYAPMLPPGGQHLFGTDEYGRDVLARVLYGGRVSLIMGLIPTVLSLLGGIVIGLPIGYLGGIFDLLLMRLTDVAMAFPSLLLALAVVAVLGPGEVQIMAAIGVAWTPYFVRMIRAQAMQARETPLVEAARSLGMSSTRVMVRYILPNIFAPILIMFTMDLANAILTAAALSYLGLGVQQPTPEWGAILADGQQYFDVAWWLEVFPGIALTLAVLGANLIGDGLRDYLDPRVRN